MGDAVPNTPSTTIPKDQGQSLPKQISDWLNLYSQVAGGPTVTETSKSNVTADQAAAMLQRALGSNGVLANIGAQERTAGAGRSSGAMFARNDLMSKLAADLAAKQAGTTTTKQVGGVASPQILGGAAGAAGLYSLYQFLNGAGKNAKPGEQTPWEALKGGWNSLFGDSANSGSAGSSGQSANANFDLGSVLNNFNAFSSGGLDSLSALMGNTGNSAQAAGASGSLGPADMLSMADAGGKAATSFFDSANPVNLASLYNTGHSVEQNTTDSNQASARFAVAGGAVGGMLGGAQGASQGAAIGNAIGEGWLGQQMNPVYEAQTQAVSDAGKVLETAGQQIAGGLEDAGTSLSNAVKGLFGW